MSSLNSFDFTGRLGRDPELRNTPNGNEVCNLTVAVDTFGDRPTLWIDVSVWGKGAEACARYLAKGREVAIHGTVDAVEAYAKKDGTLGASMRVSTRDVSFIGGRDDAAPKSDVPLDDFQPAGAAAGSNAPVADDGIPFACSAI